MELIKLPSNLTAAINPAELNRQVRQGQAVLDWSEVEEAPAPLLLELLAGFDLVNDGEALGIDSVPDALAKAVMGALRKAPRTVADKINLSLPSSTPKPTNNGPALWQAEPPPAPVVVEPSVDEASSPETPDTAEAKPAGSVLKPISEYQLRAELETLVLKDLLGPAGGPEEELEEKGRDRYLVGLLAPGRLQADPDPDEHLDTAEQEEISRPGGASGSSEDGSGDAVSQQLISFTPSSLGLSFEVVGSAATLKITARWGHYQRIYSDQRTKADGSAKLVWKRTPRQGTTTLALKEGKVKEWQPDPREQPGVVVNGMVRRGKEGSYWSVTLFLVNKQSEPQKNRDSAWLFQPELVVEAPDGAGIFQKRNLERTGLVSHPDREEQFAMEMLYRKRVNFASGHGVSVHADTLLGNPTCAYRLTTQVAPTYEVARTDHLSPQSSPTLAGLPLGMAELARLEAAEVKAKLGPLVEAYQLWLNQQRIRLNAEPDLKSYKAVGAKALDRGEATLKRIEAGIALLAKNPQALQAFRFMNEAMHRQFVQSRVAEAKRQGRTLKVEAVEPPAWRPFQLAFVLLNLPSLTDLHHPDRSAEAGALADLLWFPTGGGKTEAYLGLTAYTLAIRRLQGEVGGRNGEEGVAVIMRYTLRLLTLQQFQRAAALICACEVLRRENILRGEARWGHTPFRLGLWVGQRATPNTTSASEESLKQDGGRGSVIGGSGTPRQLTNCPWCGHQVKVIVESFQKGSGRTLMYCQDPLGSCPFSEKKAGGEGVPVLVVDEEIYRRLPSLLIATVDKFAQLPWKGAVGMLFGQVSQKCERHGFVFPDAPTDSKEPAYHPAKPGLPAARIVEHPPLRPPDLIIQDELHLISGPLGTLVGLYETAVDHLCSWQFDGQIVRPKVVAATATIRRAERQIKAVFLRQVNIFPPPGLDITDNFFSQQTPPEEATPGRRYLGICASGRRLKAALIRVYVAYLSAGEYLFEKYGSLADPYMTLVGYFNSLTDLGGTRRLVEDEVRTRLLRMQERGLAARKLSFTGIEELTSRRSSVDIPRLLDQLERKFEPRERGDNKVKTGELWQSRPLDVLLATNMISVGVDVQRLGLMVVTSQPKNTAEYIQATSRVGRRSPGLVCVVYNWARPRDLSHYEQFEHYHATYYQYVEALSVTPFAARAVDRGLSALLVSYIRHTGSDYTENEKAGQFKSDNPNYSLAVKMLSSRAEQVKDKAASSLIKTRLLELEERWVAEAAVKGRKLGYREEAGTVVGLLEQPGRGEWKAFTCLNSLRDVEPTVKLILDERGIGETRGDSAGIKAADSQFESQSKNNIDNHDNNPE